VTDGERYLASVAAQVRGAGSGRLRAELRDHLEDAIAHHVACGRDATEAVQLAVERLGSASALGTAWRAQASVRRVRARRRAALVAFAAAAASALALVQHASGHAPGHGDRMMTTAPATEALPPETRSLHSVLSPGNGISGPFLGSGVGRTAHCRGTPRCR
jgi:hypothetical protein